MRVFGIILAVLTLVALAKWAYSENYRTKAALDRVAELRREIGAAEERLRVLRAEWAYLNRPDRLEELVQINFPRLGLVPLSGERYGLIEQIPYAPVPPDQVQVTADVAAAAPRGRTAPGVAPSLFDEIEGVTAVPGFGPPTPETVITTPAPAEDDAEALP